MRRWLKSALFAASLLCSAPSLAQEARAVGPAIGTSGATVPLLNANNTWSAAQIISAPTSGGVSSWTWTDSTNGGTAGFTYDVASGQFIFNARSSANAFGLSNGLIRINAAMVLGWVNGGVNVTSADTTLCRQAAGVLEVGTSTTCNANGTIQATSHQITGATVVGSLPTCNGSTNLYSTRVVTDATAPAYNATLTGGGSTVVKAFCNGTNWVGG